MENEITDCSCCAESVIHGPLHNRLKFNMVGDTFYMSRTTSGTGYA